MQESEKLVGQLSDFVWGQPLLILLLDTHILPHVPPLLHAAVHRQGNQTFGLKRARNISRATGLMAEGPMYVLERGMKSSLFSQPFPHSDREHGPGKFHFVDGKRSFPHRSMDHRDRDGGAHRCRDPGRN
jgi:hypothetical protein